MYRKRGVMLENDVSDGPEKRPRTGTNVSADVLNARFLANDRRERPAGLIFMCNSSTKRDCFRYKVFGLPLAKKDVVERVTPGMRLFLFDFDSRELHGIYEAASKGGMNIEPLAFQDAKGSFPAQVRFDIHTECVPLFEDVFRDAIKENYYAQNKFDSELSSDQVLKLTQLFKQAERSRNAATDSLEILGRENHGYRLGMGLLGRNANLVDPRELSYGASKYGLASQASRMQERIPEYTLHSGHLAQNVGERIPPVLSKHDRVDLSLINPFGRLGHDPRHTDVVDKARLLQMALPQVGHLYNPAEPMKKGGIEEADQLALKYLQQSNSVVDNLGLLSVDPLSRQLLISQRERATPWLGNLSAAHQVPGAEGTGIGNISALQAGLLNQSTAQPKLGQLSSVANIGRISSAVALGPPIGVGDFLREHIGLGAVRRA